MIKSTCPRCSLKFSTLRGLNIHRTRANHWGAAPAPLPPPPEKKHVNYMDIVKDSTNSWGQSMTEHEKKHPSMETLKLGALLYIANLLVQILKELKRPKQIN